MSTQRRFSEKEIAEIFEEATRAQNEDKAQSGPMDGLTVDELKQIGASTGIDPKYIARAVAAVQRRPQQFPVQKFMGIPMGVSRSVPLPDTFSDQDWEHLVVDLRKTFKARGKIRQEGSIREWANGNLHAYVEPTAAGGYELRLQTQKGNLRGMLFMGFAYMFVALFMLISMLGSDAGMNYSFLITGLFMVAGFGMVTSAAAGQPKWARQREQQMEAICKRAVALGKEFDEEAPSLKSEEKFLSFEDEEVLNQELKQFAIKKKASRA